MIGLRGLVVGLGKFFFPVRNWADAGKVGRLLVDSQCPLHRVA